MGEEQEYDLKASIPKVGYLYPVLKDAHGNVIDGFHRLRHDPNWPVKKLDHITNPLELAKARLVTNVCRRDVPAEEKTEWLRQIATMTGWTPKEIADNLPVSYQWVMKYIPNEFKEKTWDSLTQTSPILRRRIEEEPEEPEPLTQTSQLTRRVTEFESEALDQAVTCECCNLSTFYPQDYDGRQVCPRCLRELTEGKRQLPRRKQIPAAAPQVTTRITEKPKIKEPWPDRMHPRISNMHQAIIERLQKEGIRFETEKEFCVQKTTADIYLPDYDLPIYLDGEEAHKGREDRDTQLRELLAKRHHKRVLSLTYKSNTKTQQDTIFNKIMQKIRA